MCRCADIQRQSETYLRSNYSSCPLARRSIDTSNRRLLERGQVQGTRYKGQGSRIGRVHGARYKVQGTSPYEATPEEKLRS